RGDGKEATTLTMLPSGFFVLNPVGNSYEIKGGGYGHGVGMSQTGARQLALQGKDEKEIMNYYFPNVSILSMSQVGT
ncbi:MAG: stage II sporulation protein D, partial [Eubacterium sp.]|nr:stage II sporulation protein D [Eubacterium sp.]